MPSADTWCARLIEVEACMVFTPRTASAPPALPPIPPPLPPPPPPPSFAESLDKISPVLVLDRFAHSFAMINERDQLISEKGAIAEFHNGMSFRDAFSTAHEFDAHFTCYYARSRSTGRPVSGMPRVAKSALLFMQSKLAPPKMRDMEVYGHTLALDYDLPAPKQWTDGLRRKVQDHFDMLKAKGSILATPTVFYTTAGGFRLVWDL